MDPTTGEELPYYSDKPMTEYEKIAQPLREVLKGTTPINSPSTWLEHEKMMCPLCPGTQKPHWISRCLKLWASTPEGREFFGTANAAERVHTLPRFYWNNCA